MASIEKEIFEEDKRFISEGYYRFRVETARVEKYRSELKKKENIFIVAIESDKLVGVARGVELLGGVFRMEFIGVRKEFRMKGVGPRLLNEVENEAKKRNIHKITFHTYPDPVYSAFFEQCGYSKEATLKRHVFQQDIDLFSKYLQ
jgi:GNAT superfamily N-acetyltransferase